MDSEATSSDSETASDRGAGREEKKKIFVRHELDREKKEIMKTEGNRTSIIFCLAFLLEINFALSNLSCRVAHQVLYCRKIYSYHGSTSYL
jgi:hypothetical protein